MELKVGMYVRYKRGSMGYNIEPADKIGKIINQINKSDIYELDNNNNVFENDIIKASFNIIDLIEVGDYVNGNRIGYIDDLTGSMRQFYYDYENTNNDVGHWGEEIKSIVTKEQFEQISYEL